jgi:hypothetical protein
VSDYVFQNGYDQNIFEELKKDEKKERNWREWKLN